MLKITLLVAIVAVVLLGAGAAYVLLTTKAPQPQAVVKDIAYESLNSKN